MASQSKDVSQLAIAQKLQNIPWCEEYERMISGMLYNSMVPELSDARFHARRWAHAYNNSYPDDITADGLQANRTKQLTRILGRLDTTEEGDEACIEPPFRIDYGCNISIGKRFYAGFGLTVLDCALVVIGDRVMMGPNVSIYTATHETEVQSRRDNIEFSRPVTIGNDCWIGGNAIILPGVDIGEGCTIGSGAVVTKSVPAWSVAVGSPAKVIKKVTPLEAAAKKSDATKA